MSQEAPVHSDSERNRHTGEIPQSEPAGGSGSVEDAMERVPNRFKRFLKVLGPSLITGASDDDPSGIGTYSTAGGACWDGGFTMTLMLFPPLRNGALNKSQRTSTTTTKASWPDNLGQIQTIVNASASRSIPSYSVTPPYGM